ncbi:MAG: hypothetical protein HOO91_08745 [Bacteroidales bacterium]|nr:hypothetical protein [Bacteroidales bacterium]
MKNLKELKGVKVLSKNEQKSVAGGYQHCGDGIHYCWPGWCCSFNMCVRDNSGPLCQVQP